MRRCANRRVACLVEPALLLTPATVTALSKAGTIPRKGGGFDADSDHRRRRVHRLASRGRIAARTDIACARSTSSCRRSTDESGSRPAYLRSRSRAGPRRRARRRCRCVRRCDGVDAVYHFAAAVGVGQSMYEIAHYTSVNNLGTAVLLQALSASAGGAAGGRVEHEPVRRGLVSPRRRHARRRRERALEPAAQRPDVGADRRRRRQPLEPLPTPEDEAARAVVGVRALQVRPGAAVPDDRARLRHPDRGAALLQRVRHAPGAVESVHRRAGDFRRRAC